MILLIITAAFVLNLTISLTGVAETMTKWVTVVRPVGAPRCSWR